MNEASSNVAQLRWIAGDAERTGPEAHEDVAALSGFNGLAALLAGAGGCPRMAEYPRGDSAVSGSLSRACGRRAAASHATGPSEADWRVMGEA